MKFGSLLSALIGLMVWAPAVSDARNTTGTDILLITGDDLGTYLGCYGDTIADTPNMDGIAKAGVRFDNAWVTQASCSPSRSSIMTGLYPHQNGQIGLAHLGFSMSGNFASIPSLLKESGYFTGIIGKIHVKPMSSLPFDYTAESNTFDVRSARACDGKMEEFLKAAGDKPIYLNMSYTDPHRPWMEQHEGYPEVPLKVENAKLLPFMQGLERVRELLVEVTGYYNGIRRMDACVGSALEVLKKHGRLDNTVIIVIGDHGAPFGRAKVTCYNPGMRIPMMVKWPGVSQPGTHSEALVSTLDLLPTFLDVAGTSKPMELTGTSLRTVVADPSKNLREYVFGEFTAHLLQDYYPKRTVRNKRYQLIENLLGGVPNLTPGIEGEIERNAVKVDGLVDNPAKDALIEYIHPSQFELYDLEKDPENYTNLAGKPELKEVQAGLKEALDAWRQSSNDPLLKPGEIERVGQEIDKIVSKRKDGKKGKGGNKKKG